MGHSISVITCTHNPRPEYLDRTLSALKAQSLSVEQWELLVIDNASDRPLAAGLDLSWHPGARVIREDQLGLTPARLRGIREAGTEVLVFVDDDNVLDADYLAIALKISQEWSMLGAWGGQCLPEFEQDPPEWTHRFWEFLGIRMFDQDRWSNLPQWEATPIGAGLCVRKAVAVAYGSSVLTNPNRAALDRQGNLLLGCGDMDLAYTACDMGLGIGIFTALKLFHLMPPARLEEAYLLKMVEQSVYSRVMLNFLRGNLSTQLSWKETLKLLLPLTLYPKHWFLTSQQRRFMQANNRGYKQAMKAVLQR